MTKEFVLHNPKSLDEIKRLRLDVQLLHKKFIEDLKWYEKLSLWIVDKVGTFGFLLFCVFLTITPMILPSVMVYVQFISSAFLQLVLLPLIMIGQNLQNKREKIKAKINQQLIEKSEREIETVLQHLENQNKLLEQLINK